VDNTSGSGRFTHLKPPSAMDGGFGLGPVGPEKVSIFWEFSIRWIRLKINRKFLDTRNSRKCQNKDVQA
jgi:hypothetical protein